MTINNQPKPKPMKHPPTKHKPAKRRPRRRPINPNISKEAMAEILIDLEKNDCRTPIERLEKEQQLAVLGFSDRKIKRMCKPKPFDRDKIMRDVRAIQTKALRELARTQPNYSKDNPPIIRLDP